MSERPTAGLRFVSFLLSSYDRFPLCQLPRNAPESPLAHLLLYPSYATMSMESSPANKYIASPAPPPAQLIKLKLRRVAQKLEMRKRRLCLCPAIIASILKKVITMGNILVPEH